MTALAAAEAPKDVDRILGAVSHFAILGGAWLIVPAGIYVWKRETSRFVAFHALQAAILAVAVIPMWILATLVCLLIGLVGLFVRKQEFFLVDTGLYLFAIILASAGVMALAVIGGVQALRGREWAMPLIGRLARRVLEAPRR